VPTPQPISRLAEFGTTIFAEMSARASATGAINLGQGFPDTDGPAEVMEAAIGAIREGRNQYPPGDGLPELRTAVAEHQRRFWNLDFDPEGEVLVTVGATEAIAASVLGLTEPGDTVVTFEPYYDSYAATIALAGARRRPITLRPPDFAVDLDDLAAAMADRPRLILLNSPHNPTGKVFTRDELRTVAELCDRHDVIAVTDEVYEHIAFDGPHIPLATLPGMADRTVTISSAGKTFSFTGWKIGWACARAPLIGAVRSVKQFLTYAHSPAFQVGVAAGLGLPDRVYTSLAAELQAKRDRLVVGLRSAGFEVFPPAGTYFALTDVRPLGFHDGLELCRALPEEAGVAAVPVSVFYDDKEVGGPLVRFAFCKQDDVLDEAVDRLMAWRGR
jgi:N-succinyldiaminopimelate aminotransferase